jgi:hypothetical protein
MILWLQWLLFFIFLIISFSVSIHFRLCSWSDITFRLFCSVITVSVVPTTRRPTLTSLPVIVCLCKIPVRVSPTRLQCELQYRATYSKVLTLQPLHMNRLWSLIQIMITPRTHSFPITEWRRRSLLSAPFEACAPVHKRQLTAFVYLSQAPCGRVWGSSWWLPEPSDSKIWYRVPCDSQRCWLRPKAI